MSIMVHDNHLKRCLIGVDDLRRQINDILSVTVQSQINVLAWEVYFKRQKNRTVIYHLT